MRNNSVTSTAEAMTIFDTAVCAPALQLTADRENDPERLITNICVVRNCRDYYIAA